MRWKRTIPALLLVTGLSACGDENPDSASDSATGPASPPSGLPENAGQIELPGHGPLWMVRERPPQGGFQVHVHAADGTEILADGQPLVPFVASHLSEAPTEVTCTDEGEIRVLVARTHKPPGIVFAWDLYETVYTVDGSDASGITTELQDNVLDGALRTERPELFAWEMFENCRA